MTAAATPSPVPAAKPPHPLRERNFRLWWMGSTISLLGDQFYLVAMPWVILQLTGSAVAMGTVLMASSIPRAVLMLMGGAVTDRISPRKVMMTTATARTALVTAIGCLLWFHFLALWQLYVLAFCFGVADAFAFPAAMAFMPSLVKREQMVAASSVSQSTSQLAGIVTPAPAGLAIKALGLAWAFFIDAVSFLFILAALWKLPDPPVTPKAARKPVWSSIGEGLRYVGKDVPLRTLMLVAAVMNFCIAGSISIGLALLTKTRFGSPAAFGTVLSAAAAGSLGGALLAGIWKVRRRGALILAVAVLLGVSLSVIGLLPKLWMVAAVLLVMGLSAGLTNVHIGAWIQQRVDQSVRGRITSVLMLSVVGLMPVSYAVAGLLAAWSLKGLFLIAGASLVVVAGIGALQKPVRDIE
ncbi:MAG TPA: MFS transporter [Candidatus Angelobacter sp.]|nr:MFS transporter [Candidatus Angelobacter sp.]